MKDQITTQQVAEMAKIHRDTLLRWLREGRIPEPSRDRNGWRVFTTEEAQFIVNYAQSGTLSAPSKSLKEPPIVYTVSPVAKLEKLDWDFVEANTGYLTHSLHPYPAKFIPQIPNALIQALSSVGDTVLDPFCGSGTTLVEALLLKRHAIGIDASPLSCLIASAKTSRLTDDDIACLRQLEAQIATVVQQRLYSALPLFPDLKPMQTSAARPDFKGIDFWFDSQVIDELAALKAMCMGIESEPARKIALTVFSSIIVTVSRQDSDTRYVRREKNIQPGDTTQRFARALGPAIGRAVEFTELTEPRFACDVINANTLEQPKIRAVDLVVCSPPYPNAYSYHLYHRTRMLWLDMDQPTFKQVEIGSHRKYSKKGNSAANEGTFRDEMRRILDWLRTCVRPNGYVCFVIGDSVLKGSIIRNDQLLIEVATGLGYFSEANLARRLQDSKKSFNPSIGKIKEEHIVVLRNSGSPNA
jgi:site-specific DNA-methyltransferase (cytosine-N4-specific)